MFRSTRIAFIALGALTFGLYTHQALAADEPANLIKYRQAIMKAIGGHMGALGAVAKGEVSFTDEVVGHAHAINEMSKNLLRLFPEGSGYEIDKKSNVLPAVWERWTDFEAAVKALQDESTKMIAVAESGDAAAFGQQVGALGRDGCTNCHDTFRYKE
ncbi:MAG: c-type cytochrome [Geminicoccales bacterium]